MPHKYPPEFKGDVGRSLAVGGRPVADRIRLRDLDVATLKRWMVQAGIDDGERRAVAVRGGLDPEVVVPRRWRAR